MRLDCNRFDKTDPVLPVCRVWPEVRLPVRNRIDWSRRIRRVLRFNALLMNLILLSHRAKAGLHQAYEFRR